MPPDEGTITDEPAATEEGGGDEATWDAPEPPADFDMRRAWKEIKDRRKSEDSYRRRAKEAEEKLAPYEKSLGQLHETDRSALLGLAETLVVDPKAAAEWMRSNADALSPAEQRQVAAEVGKDPDSSLTREDVMAIFKEQEQAREVAEAQRQIDKDATELGFPPGSRDYVALLYEAHTNQGDDLAKAAEVIKAEREAQQQHAVEEYLAGKAGQAAGAPRTTPAGAAPGTVQTPPKTIEEAAARSRARFGR